ncbi:MAG: hypothetical protein NTX72_00555 [Candidatus Uhrbacteria bacterium]|nr:hypothetical protein [Candidatus Uhrbacteria bacterium]
MIRACPRSLVISLSLALLAMSFMIGAASGCGSTSSVSFFQGPFCSVEHASSPIHTEKHAPDMALTQELASILAAVIVYAICSKRILEKSLVRFLAITGRIGRREHLRPRTGPIPFDLFLPQISSAHGF